MALLDLCVRIPESKNSRHGRTWWALRLYYNDPNQMRFDSWAFLKNIPIAFSVRAPAQFDTTQGLEKYLFRGNPQRACLSISVGDLFELLKFLLKRCPTMVPLWLKSQQNHPLDFFDTFAKVTGRQYHELVQEASSTMTIAKPAMASFERMQAIAV